MSRSAAWRCYQGPILSSPNRLTRFSTVSTMSRLESSPTSTRAASTANFIRIPLMGTPGLSAMAPGLPSCSSPDCAAAAGPSLAIAKEERTGQVAFTGRAPVHLQWRQSSRRRRRRRRSISSSAELLTVCGRTSQTFPSPSKTVSHKEPRKWAERRKVDELVADRPWTSPLRSAANDPSPGLRKLVADGRISAGESREKCAAGDREVRQVNDGARPPQQPLLRSDERGHADFMRLSPLSSGSCYRQLTGGAFDRSQNSQAGRRRKSACGSGRSR